MPGVRRVRSDFASATAIPRCGVRPATDRATRQELVRPGGGRDYRAARSARSCRNPREPAGAEVVVAHPVRDDRDARHLVVHVAAVLLELGGRFGAHAFPGGGQVFLDHAVDDRDASPAAYRQGARLVGCVTAVDRQSDVRSGRQRRDLGGGRGRGKHELRARPEESDGDHPWRGILPGIREVSHRRRREQLLCAGGRQLGLDLVPLHERSPSVVPRPSWSRTTGDGAGRAFSTSVGGQRRSASFSRAAWRVR